MNLLQTDSTAALIEEEAVLPIGVDNQRSEPKHPYQVLRKLPADATPAQQDSAIQAAFSVENTHLSTRPDTLHLPGHDMGRDIRDVDIPQYYRETFFAKDSLLRAEISDMRYGEAGDPVPYTIHGDNILTALLLGSFLFALVAFSKSRCFVSLQLKHLFYEPTGLTTEVSETSGEVRFQFFLALQTCLLFSIISFIYVQQCVADTFILLSQYYLIWIFFGCFVAHFAVRILLYWAVNNVFFDSKKSVRWLKTLLFVTATEGIALFPLVMLLSYFYFSVQNAVIYVATVIIIVKLLMLYKCKMAFFRQKGGYLQIILYFCALEIMPLLSLWGVMAMIVNYVKINY